MRKVISLFCISTASVISSSSRCGASRDDASAPSTAGSRPLLANWVGDRLTATQMSSGHFAASSHADLMTHSPSATIRPISSATGINSTGDTMPRSGWCQRSSASQQRTSPCVQIQHRLVIQLELAVLEARWRSAISSARRSFIRASMCRFEEPVNAAAVRLGAVERHVGVLEKLVGIVAVSRRQRDADTGVDDDRVAVQIVRRPDRLGDAARQPLRRRARRRHRSE